MKFSSTAFMAGGAIPRKHTCDGRDVSPQLSWSEMPAGTKSLALILDDPDAPGRAFVHWVLYDIPATASELVEGVQGMGVLGTNNFRRMVYSGPCPPPGPAHRYFFKLYALDKLLGLRPGATKADVESAMQDHILDTAQIMGRYGR